jgi:EmrB/QacA subfamily drug resistance transporter
LPLTGWSYCAAELFCGRRPVRRVRHFQVLLAVFTLAGLAPLELSRLRLPGALALPRHILVPLIVSCSLLMQNLDSTALVTALPLIAESLSETPLRLHMAITAYMLAFAAFLPLSGWVADKYGARQIFRLSMLIFTVSSIMCGYAQTYEQLILFRIIQGFGGAMMVPVGRLILVRSVPKAELVNAMIIMGLPSFIGPVLGPVVGGFIATFASWRWIFWMNVPVGIFGIFLVTVFIKDVRETSVKSFDWTGFAMLSFGLGAAVFGLDAVMTRHATDALSLLLLPAGAMSLALYVFHARRSDKPILDLSLLRIASFRISITTGSIFRIGIGANPFLLPMMMQVGFGYSPFHSGLITCVSSIGAFFMRTVAKKLLTFFGFRNVLIWNGMIAGLFLAACGLFRPDTSKAIMLAVIFMGGVFRSLQFTSLNAVAYADLDQSQMSHATSFQQMSQRLSMSVGIAVAATILHVASGSSNTVPVSAFAWAFAIIGLGSTISSFWFARLPLDAGAEMSGRKKDIPSTISDRDQGTAKESTRRD